MAAAADVYAPQARSVRGLAVRACLAAVALSGLMGTRADVLVGTNGERFVGRFIEKKDDAVVFESELGGRMTVPWSRIKELERSESTAATAATAAATNATNVAAATATNLNWRPPMAGQDGADWVQLKSGEWLRGKFWYLQDKKIEFDSDELDDLSLKLKNVRQLHPGQPMFTKFHDREQIYGLVSLSNNMVIVTGTNNATTSREDLEGITPGGSKERSYWSGRADVGLNFQSGNTRAATLGAGISLDRRTPVTRFSVGYNGNYGEVDGVESANNHRTTIGYDVRLTRRWFVIPALGEYYRDPPANVAHRGTVAVGAGYDIFDRDDLEWRIAAGPGFQYTVFETVEPGEPDSTSTAAGVLYSRFKAKLARRLDLTLLYQGIMTSREAGLYTHHSEMRLEFEIKHYLDFDVTFVWDYILEPQTRRSGTEPEHHDLRLTVGLGSRF